MLAHVLSFDGALGARSEVVDGHYTGPPRRALHLPRGQGGGDARARRAPRTSTSPPPTPTPTRSPTCRCCAPSATRSRSTPTPSCAASRARRAGRSCASSSSAGALKAAAALSPSPRWWAPARRDGGGCAAMSLHELTDEQREIRDLARRFADEEIAPQAAAWDREHTLPARGLRAARRARADGRVRARGARRRRRRLPLLRARARGALARRRGGGGDRRRPHERGHAAAAHPRHARAGRRGSSRRWPRATSSRPSR